MPVRRHPRRPAEALRISSAVPSVKRSTSVVKSCAIEPLLVSNASERCSLASFTVSRIDPCPQRPRQSPAPQPARKDRKRPCSKWKLPPSRSSVKSLTVTALGPGQVPATRRRSSAAFGACAGPFGSIGRAVCAHALTAIRSTGRKTALKSMRPNYCACASSTMNNMTDDRTSHRNPPNLVQKTALAIAESAKSLTRRPTAL